MVSVGVNFGVCVETGSEVCGSVTYDSIKISGWCEQAEIRKIVVVKISSIVMLRIFLIITRNFNSDNIQ